ncbi:Uncharacterised protein [Tissierella praeacuta]|nr:Uncharacterised protein [Tissierella praeacuta]
MYQYKNVKLTPKGFIVSELEMVYQWNLKLFLKEK